MISVFSSRIGREELDAIARVADTGWLGTGKQCTEFERELSEHFGVPQILLTNSCTSAIYVGVRALALSPGDEVIVPSINYIAAASAVVDVGAVPVFADVDPHTLNILPREIERLKTPRTKAVLLLHYGGHPCEMDEILEVCGDSIAILEDCAIAVDSIYKSRRCGTFGAAGFWSFNATKAISMIDGGALYLRDADALSRAVPFRFLGLPEKQKSGMDAMTNKQSRWWEFQIEATASLYVSNDIAAAIGREQLKKLPGFIARRKQIWQHYQQRFADLGDMILPPEPLKDSTSSYFFYWIQTDRRDNLATHLLERDIYTTFRYYPLHLQNHYGLPPMLPNAKRASERTLNLPLHANLSDAQVETVVEHVRNFFQAR